MRKELPADGARATAGQSALPRWSYAASKIAGESAVFGAALDAKGGLYNIGSDRETLIADLAKLVFDVAGFHPEVDARPAPPGSVRRRVPHTRKHRSLGFAPQRELRQGIAECWQRAPRA